MRLATLFVGTFLLLTSVPFVVEDAAACQPLWWRCPLNGNYYAVCGTASPPPIVKCAQDTLRDLALP